MGEVSMSSAVNVTAIWSRSLARRQIWTD